MDPDFRDPTLPDTVQVLAPTGDRLIPAHRVPLLFPGLEGIAASLVGAPVPIWALSNWPDGVWLRGVTWLREGRPHIGVNVATNVCPLHRLAVVAHEARHIQRGDLRDPPTGDRLVEAEQDCRAAGGDVLSDGVGAVAVRTRAPIDGATCRACYDGGGQPCGQGAAVFQAVEAVLGPLTKGVPAASAGAAGAIVEAVPVGFRSKGVLRIGPWDPLDDDRPGLVRIQEAVRA